MVIDQEDEYLKKGSVGLGGESGPSDECSTSECDLFLLCLCLQIEPPLRLSQLLTSDLRCASDSRVGAGSGRHAPITS